MTEVEVGKFVAQAAISLGGAFLAAWLAAKRFRKDKWWERKSAAYSELIDALHRMKWPASEHLDAGFEDREVSKDESERLWEEFKTARRSVWRIADGSAFLISSKVLDAVRAMEKDLESARNAQSWFEHLDQQYGAIQKCLDNVKDIGTKELGVKDA